MRLGLLLSLLLVVCAVVGVLCQENPAGEKPVHDPTVPDEPYSTDPERPPDDPNTIASNSADKSSSDEGGSSCIALAMQCPDGSYASQDSACNYICGAPPTGNLNWSYVDNVRMEFQAAYNPISLYIGDMQGKNIVVHPPEKKTDLCLEVTISTQDVNVYPAVYNSVRVFYTKINITPVCSPQLCPDGSVVGCDDTCPEAPESSSLFMPFVLVFSVVLLSACCCCIRRRRCKAECRTAMKPFDIQQVVPSHAYPAEYYELLQQEQALAQSLEVPDMPPQIPPHMMAQPMIFPPMPHIPPHMLQNGAFPVMIQAPNGVWYMAPPHPEDA